MAPHQHVQILVNEENLGTGVLSASLLGNSPQVSGNQETALIFVNARVIVQVCGGPSNSRHFDGSWSGAHSLGWPWPK